jgi:hypothetical protein
MRGGNLIAGLGAMIGTGASAGNSSAGGFAGMGVIGAGTWSDANLFGGAVGPLRSATADFSGIAICTTRSATGALLGGAEAQAPSVNTTQKSKPVFKLRYICALSLCDNEKTYCAGQRKTKWHVRLPGQRKSPQ